jgi:hypothetical protein
MNNNNHHHSSPFHQPPPPLSFYPPQHHIMEAAVSSPHILMSPPPPPPPSSHHSFPSSTNTSQYFIPPPPVPRHQLRRYRTIKRLVQIPQGKLVLDCPLPIQYLERVPVRDPREFNTMRYTAITCDASEFVQKKYTLRQEIMKRETEIVICITMYNVCFCCFFP